MNSGLLFAIAGIMFSLMTFTSCTTTRQLTYLQGSFDTARLSKVEIPELQVQKGDLLEIVVHSDNEVASGPFNHQPGSGSFSQSIGGGSGTTNTPGTGGYLVDQHGDIQFPVIGNLHVEGLTKTKLIQLLDDSVQSYLTHPYYNIRFLNYKITLLGELNKPGVYSIPNEQLNILQAVGLAGDLTFYGRRDNIYIIREINGKREFGRVDIRDPNIFLSPYFQLQQNDIVYVEANKKKISASDQTVIRNVSIITSVLSAFAIVYSVFRR